MNGADPNQTIVSALLLHDAKIVLSMLVEILGFNDFTASRPILRHRCVPFIVVRGILDRVATITYLKAVYIAAVPNLTAGALKTR